MAGGRQGALEDCRRGLADREDECPDRCRCRGRIHEADARDAGSLTNTRGVSHVSDAVLADLCSALDFVVLERLEGGFVRIGDGPLPPWFVRVFIHAQGDGPTLTLTDAFPVLDTF